MSQAAHRRGSLGDGPPQAKPLTDARSVFAQAGGRPILERVNKIFYDKVYAHPWLCQFFEGIDQSFIEAQQTDFMMGNMGGERSYRGAAPKHAHKHLFITDELYDLRQQLLRESLAEAGLSGAISKQWIRIDEAFRRSLVKTSPAECVRQIRTEPVVVVPKP